MKDSLLTAKEAHAHNLAVYSKRIGYTGEITFALPDDMTLGKKGPAMYLAVKSALRERYGCAILSLTPRVLDRLCRAVCESVTRKIKADQTQFAASPTYMTIFLERLQLQLRSIPTHEAAGCFQYAEQAVEYGERLVRAKTK